MQEEFNEKPPSSYPNHLGSGKMVSLIGQKNFLPASLFNQYSFGFGKIAERKPSTHCQIWNEIASS